MSDGVVLYAADALHGALKDRALIPLDSAEPPNDLWWLSVHGIYRPRDHEPPSIAWPIRAPESHAWRSLSKMKLCCIRSTSYQRSASRMLASQQTLLRGSSLTCTQTVLSISHAFPRQSRQF